MDARESGKNVPRPAFGTTVARAFMSHVDEEQRSSERPMVVNIVQGSVRVVGKLLSMWAFTHWPTVDVLDVFDWTTTHQDVLSDEYYASKSNHTETSIWLSTLMIPAYAAALSALALILHILLVKCTGHKASRVARPPVMNLPSGFVAKFNAHVATHGGWMIYAHGIARFVGLLALLGLSTASLILDEAEQQETVDVNGKWGSKHEAKNQGELFTKRQRLEAVMCMVYVSVYLYFVDRVFVRTSGLQ
ncbi:hypothetical protein FISHEDRAFT_74503 [Fistulina hepatica ATCC 64428]|uniref:Uncharacterized protein n=1 Tax=Fistulina hepatica ATCC 64428 TaxID=1128425 RepID=A0A0D7AA57_9AGAR|nr:hypothetical protein FISHEDRAFT_74503 [Fistulina hepatica ATCC 64428]